MNRSKLLVAFVATLFVLNVQAQTGRGQEAVNDTLYSPMMDVQMGEVVVSSLRIDRKIKELPVSLSVIGLKDYQNRASLTISNVLGNEAGIAMGGDGVWATNINIRGLGENRLVTLIDGNRVETATDLTVSLSMLDVNEIERVEVIKGAQSSLYGTGAMGGIVNVITKEGRFSKKPYVSGDLITGFASANKYLSNYADISTGAEKWYLRLGGSYGKADDMRTPEGELPNSQFTTGNFSAKAGLKPLDNHLLKVQYQRSASNDVGIPGGEAFPGPAEATYSNIERDLLSASYTITGITDKFSSLKLNYFYQGIVRDVSLSPNTVTQTTLPNGNVQRTTPQLFTPSGVHRTNGAQLQGNWELAANNTLIAGADVWGRKLTTSREKYIRVDILNPLGDTVKTNIMERGETPIPESSFTSAGLFLQNETNMLGDRLKLIVGGRLDGIWITNDEGHDVDYLVVNGTRNDAPATQRVTFEAGSERSISWSANAGILYGLTDNTDISMNLTRSFRAPSLEERFKYIDLGNYVQLGDPALKPESGYGADLGVRVWGDRLSMQSELFVNRLSNMIVETPGEFIYTLTSGSEPDTLPALVNSNVSKALLYGFDISLDYNFSSDWMLYFTGSYVRGLNTEADENLPLIPPLRGSTGIRYNREKIGSAELTLSGAARQDKVADGEEETDGYLRLDLSLSSRKFDLGFASLRLFAGVDNITDASYTNHLSTNRGSISVEPGRNIFVRVSLGF